MKCCRQNRSTMAQTNYVCGLNTYSGLGGGGNRNIFSYKKALYVKTNH
jgi:hypothetical protein